MPPQLSDDETSEVSEEVPRTVVEKGGEKTPSAKAESLRVSSDDEKDADDAEDDDEEIGEDEYIVEAILSHVIDEESGEILYEVKWEGYEKKSDRTWEPESNLETASKILNEYLQSNGGKEHILTQYHAKKTQSGEKKGKKRSRQSMGTPKGETNGSKKSRKMEPHPADSTPPASVRKAEFKPPPGNWEEEVIDIDACEGSEGNVIVYLEWKNGHKSQHPLAQVYKRCPQKMLKFYESHLVFKKT